MGTDDILVFSTDYPHFDFDDPNAAVPRQLPEELREKILWKNAAGFYGLDLPPAGRMAAVVPAWKLVPVPDDAPTRSPARSSSRAARRIT